MFNEHCDEAAGQTKQYLNWWWSTGQSPGISSPLPRSLAWMRSLPPHHIMSCTACLPSVATTSRSISHVMLLCFLSGLAANSTAAATSASAPSASETISDVTATTKVDVGNASSTEDLPTTARPDSEAPTSSAAPHSNGAHTTQEEKGWFASSAINTPSPNSKKRGKHGRRTKPRRVADTRHSHEVRLRTAAAIGLSSVTFLSIILAMFCACANTSTRQALCQKCRRGPFAAHRRPRPPQMTLTPSSTQLQTRLLDEDQLPAEDACPV
eukprot:scpid94435/ scgid35728/ 